MTKAECVELLFKFYVASVQALDALALQPWAGVGVWTPAQAAQRVEAKRALRRLLAEFCQSDIWDDDSIPTGGKR